MLGRKLGELKGFRVRIGESDDAGWGVAELRLCGNCFDGFIMGELVGWKLKAWQVHRLGLGLSG